LPFTGGAINISSSLNNARDFNNKTSNFSSNWANISYQQTINGFNSFRWNKKLNVLQKSKDSIAFLKEKKEMIYEVSKMYTEIQPLSLKSHLYKMDIDKTQKILFEFEQKLKYGKVLKIDIEQLKITLERLQSQLEINELHYASSLKSLKNTINMNNQKDINLKPIEEIDFEINKELLVEAIKNNGFDVEKTIRLLESESSIDKAKKEGAIAVSLQLGMGLNSSANTISNLYETPAQSQFVTVGTKILILDWGKSKKNIAIAKLDKATIEYEIQDNEKKMEQQVDDLLQYHLTLKAQLKSLKQQLKLNNTITEMFDELMKYGRKTISEYNTQLVESFNTVIEYQKTVNNLYLLKLKIDEITLNF
jgi:outer membrane protein